MEFFYSHAHYDDAKFDDNRESLIIDIYKSGVTKIISAGYSLEGSKKSLELSSKYNFIYSTVGISPNDLVERGLEENIAKVNENNDIQEENKKIESIKEKISLINNIKGMNIIKENEEEIEIFDALDYTNITIDEINILIIKLDKLIEKNKSAFLETINTKIAELLKLASEGTNSGLLLDEEIWNYIDSKLNNKKQIKKVKVSKNGRK